MTTGYVFRVENQATVAFLQKVGLTGRLSTLNVQRIAQTSSWKRFVAQFYALENASAIPTIAYLLCPLLTVFVLTVLCLSEDWWGLPVVGLLVLSRLLNTLVIRRRAATGWKGASEPGVHGDLLILMSQDRWIRIRGLVDDLKAVTSGQWLRDATFIEESITALATLLVYLDAALSSNVNLLGKILLLILLVSSAGLLAIANEKTDVLLMHGRKLKIDGRPKHYARRLDMAKELTAEMGRDDWAVRLGMIVPDNKGTEEGVAKDEPLTM
ncbi:MAG: hypothetical protein M1820_010438 [Bogoriella megaspora]|nr:MAG: hypothetical protein M1820_010438 [Bogoriella megaspora]